MGIHSDVAICLKTELDERLRNLPLLQEGRRIESAEGAMYLFESIKWYRTLDEEITKLYETLDEANEEDFLVIDVCHDYPSSNDGDVGCWYDNPWDVHRVVSARLVFKETETS